MDKKMVMIAMVLLVATPILLGYAMAFEDVTRTNYSASETKNVTDLLYNDTTYAAVQLDSYALNSNVLINAGFSDAVFPVYTSVGSAASTVPYETKSVTSGTTLTLSDYLGFTLVDSLNLGQVSATITLDDSTSTTYALYSLHYSAETGILEGAYAYGISDYTFSITNAVSVSFLQSASVYCIPTISNASTYANLVDGWVVPELSEYYSEELYYYIPGSTSGSHSDDMILSMNLGGFLGTLTYNVLYEYNNTTVAVPLVITSAMVEENSVPVGHTLTVQYGSQDAQTLYMKQTVGFTPSSDSNWYQLRVTPETVALYYVADLPSTFGAAYPYDSVTWDNTTDYDRYSVFAITLPLDYTIEYRGDMSIERGFAYPVMSDVDYKPADLSGDSSEVRINNVSRYGSSIEWGGVSYTVTDGAIYVDGHKIQLTKTNLILRTIYEDSVYTNTINGYDVSTTSAAPTMTLGGMWDCTVQSITLEGTTETTTEWQAGEFAWNGIDESFALVGLMTCVAVFIGLGMYGRRSGAKVGTLMVICGCAAFVFLALM